MNFDNIKPLELNDKDLIQVEWAKYKKEEFKKNQIVLHHTVSGPGITGDLATWEKYESDVATFCIIDREGKINQLFSSKYWAYHIGAGKKSLEQHSIGIELDNWGPLTPINRDKGIFKTLYGNTVTTLGTYYPKGFRGYAWYESYTEPQLRSLGELLLYFKEIYNIPLTYNESMWEVSQNALNGESGVWSHVSYRKPSDKQDAHPDPNLISLLRALN